eukprot:2939077-Pleurochrysis_carterae.AAC.1
MYDGVQMFKELKYELANLQYAYDADEHGREIERMRDDKVNKLIRDNNPYIQVLYVGERLGRLVIKSLPAALAGDGRALLRELIDKKLIGKESR